MDRSLVAVSFAVLTLVCGIEPALAQGTRQKGQQRLACKQILVRSISVPAVWTGPSIDDVDWRSDSKIADLASKLAARRLPLEDAQREVTDFAKMLGPDKTTKLTALFAGLYYKLNGERVQIIDGLDRFGHKQKELGDKLREETAALHAAQDQAGGTPLPDIKDKSEPTATPSASATILEKLQWDMRIFEDRHKALSFVCESPILIEQRLFALARTIQENMN